jgi:hypothetical protein
MNPNSKWLTKLAVAVALAPLAIAAIASPAQADDHRRDRHWDHHDRGYYGGGGYYAAPPPPVYYAPPQPRVSPGISLFFPIR